MIDMQILEKNGSQIIWGGMSMKYIGYEIVDTQMIHIIFEDNTIGFKAGETMMNGVLQNSVDEMIMSLNG